MKINWKLRLKNKTTLAALLAALVTLVYQILSALGVTPQITQDSITQAIGMILNLLAVLGVVVDPTTQGMSDSDNALTYSKPK